MSAAEELRQAAETLRERASQAAPGPWHIDGPFWVDPPGLPISEMTVEVRDGVTDFNRELVMEGTWKTEDRNAAFIATMHPGVGLALADLLETLAYDHDQADLDGGTWDHQVMPLVRLINGGAS